MNHGISEQEWEEFLTGTIAAAARDRIEAHLVGCLACWEHYDALQENAAAVRTAAAEVRRALALPDERLHHGFRRVMQRLPQPHRQAALEEIQARMERLELMMAGMCGAHTAASALRTAAQTSPTQSLVAVTPENWELFVQRLTSIAAVMCGDTAASLVRRKGFGGFDHFD